MRSPRRYGRAAAYLLWLLPSAIVSFLLFMFFAISGFSVVLLGLGLLLWPAIAEVVRHWTNLHRRRAGNLLGDPIPPRSLRPHGGPLARFGQVLRDGLIWRDWLWLLVNLGVGLPFAGLTLLLVVGPFVSLFTMFFWWLFPVDEPIRLLIGIPVHGPPTALGLGGLQLVILVGAALLLLPSLAKAHAALTRLLLGRSTVETLEERVETLTQTRSGAVDAHASELRRIERDLHDGTQARLVAIAMRLGIAKQAIDQDPALVERLIEDARDGAEHAMTELRAIIRTMYPPILADQGLTGAIDALVADAAVPVEVRAGDLTGLPPAVETASYYVVSEALTNISKHAHATSARLELGRDGDTLRVTVTDDGTGGADETVGSGIIGIRRRVAALDGTTTVDSVAGEGTTITVELPCGS